MIKLTKIYGLFLRGRLYRLGLLLGAFMASNMAFAEMSNMQKAKYASPMPNLMMLIESHAYELELDNAQLEIVRNWRKANHHQVQQWMNELIETEKFMHDAALEGATDAEITDYKRDVLKKREELIDLKARCVKRMHDTLDDKQWEVLMALYQQKRQAMMGNTQQVNEVQSFLRVSPMPKLMVIVLMQGDKLNLTAEQDKALEQWRIEHMTRWSAMFDEVVRTEKHLTWEALEMAPAEKLEKRFSELLELRKNMAAMSLACRDNVRRILNDRERSKFCVKPSFLNIQSLV